MSPSVTTSSQQEDRDPSNFDFRALAVLAIMTSRPDLLREYLDGKSKDTADPAKWPTLRSFGLPDNLLNELLSLFEREDVQHALPVIQTLTQTAVAQQSYCSVGCPPNESLRMFVPLMAQLTQPLKRAGIEVESEIPCPESTMTA
jgi:hypothetical protein